MLMWELATRMEPYDEFEDLKLTQSMKIDKNSDIGIISREAEGCGWRVDKVDSENGIVLMSQPNSFKIQDLIIKVRGGTRDKREGGTRGRDEGRKDEGGTREGRTGEGRGKGRGRAREDEGRKDGGEGRGRALFMLLRRDCDRKFRQQFRPRLQK
jgi:hypothetical protein